MQPIWSKTTPSLGASYLRFGRPVFTYTSTLAIVWPSPITSVSLSGTLFFQTAAQAGIPRMPPGPLSGVRTPSSFTTPEMDPVGPAGAVGDGAWGVEGDPDVGAGGGFAVPPPPDDSLL